MKEPESEKKARAMAESLAERLVRFARRKGLKVVEKTFSVCVEMDNGDILTAYRLPARDISGYRVRLLYGEIFYPYRRYERHKSITEETAEFIYRRLGEMESERDKATEQ